MSLFAPAASAPAVVLAYHAARSAWERIALDDRLARDGVFGGREYAAYVRADGDLAEALRGLGGEWTVGPVRYRLRPRGIEISRVFPGHEGADVDLHALP